MPEFDDFAAQLLEESKRFLEKAAVVENQPDVEGAYLHASLSVGFAALEAHINAVADDFLVREDLPLVDQSILYEQDIRLENGQFELSQQPKFYRLEERIRFLYRRFSGNDVDPGAQWWSQLRAGVRLRNKLTHPKEISRLSEASVGQAIQGIVDTLDALYHAVYQREYPAVRRGLSSEMEF